MANLGLLWDQIDQILTQMDSVNPDDSLWVDPDKCEHPCVHGTMVTGPTCCKCGKVL